MTLFQLSDLEYARTTTMFYKKRVTLFLNFVYGVCKKPIGTRYIGQSTSSISYIIFVLGGGLLSLISQV